MERTWRRLARPVLVLLVIGVIVGLGFLYVRVDGGRVDAEGSDLDANTPPIEETLPDAESTPPIVDVPENVVKPETKPDEPSTPLPDEDVIDDDGIALGGDSLASVHDVGRGYAVLTTVTSGVNVRYIERGESVSSIHIEGDYITSSVGRYGIAVVVRVNDSVNIVVLDTSLMEISRHVLDDVRGYLSILLGDDLTICYESTNGVNIVVYGDKVVNNSILDIDNIGRLIATYSTGYGDSYLVFDDGLVVNTLPTIWRTRRRLGYRVDSVLPILVSGSLAYAIMGAKGDVVHFVEEDFTPIRDSMTNGGAMVFADRLHIIKDGMMDSYCTCGEYDERVATNIAKVTHIDYANGKLYFAGCDSLSYALDYKSGVEQLLDKAVLYANNDIIITDDMVLYSTQVESDVAK